MLLSLLPSIVILGLAALVALRQTLTCRPSAAGDGTLDVAAAVLAVTASIQAIHFAEEALTNFPARLAALLGLPAMPMSFFIAFNLGWLGIWAASVPGLRAAKGGAIFAAWFLAIAGMINGIAHPLLAIASAAYFPGLVSSPFIGVAGIWLWKKMQATGKPCAH